MRSLLLLVILLMPVPSVLAETLPGFRPAASFDEQIHETWWTDSVRGVLLAIREFDPALPTQLVIYATPNGNTIEQTLGCARGAELDWRFDIQHVAAQIRRWRQVHPGENIVLACLEADGLSWPAWRQKLGEQAPAAARMLIESIRTTVAPTAQVMLTGHSGGGSLLFAMLDAHEAIPAWIDQIAFLDSNYSYDDGRRHGEKLLTWIQADTGRALVVIAYDDREIQLNGKKVVGPTGGTYRATERMRRRFAADVTFNTVEAGPMLTETACDGRLLMHVHRNPENKILHTALVGEMNGLLEALSHGRSDRAWGTWGGPRAYLDWIQPAPGIPPRPADAKAGHRVLQAVAELSLAEREAVLTAELLRGNLPDFLRRWQRITVETSPEAQPRQTIVYEVFPDYLAIGSDADFVRVPLTPLAAQRVADAFGAALPTRKMVDDIARKATVRLEPQPLTERREAVTTFVQHHDLIEAQFGDQPRGTLVAGIKKDVVITNRLGERPKRVALYGWHHRNNHPIQPLTIVHHQGYVDYSHGIRLVKRTVLVNGKPRDLHHILHDETLSPLLSDEGRIVHVTY